MIASAEPPRLAWRLSGAVAKMGRPKMSISAAAVPPAPSLRSHGLSLFMWGRICRDASSMPAVAPAVASSVRKIAGAAASGPCPSGLTRRWRRRRCQHDQAEQRRCRRDRGSHSTSPAS